MTAGRIASRKRKGGAAVELIVLFPFILLLLVGAVDYGRVYYTSVTVANAARAGADFGQWNGVATETDTVNMRLAAETDGAEAGALTITKGWFCECAGTAHACTACSGGAAPEVYVQVTASKAIDTYFPYPGLPGRITISRTAIFRSQ